MSDGEGAHITGVITICWRRALEAEKIEKHFRFGRLWRRHPHNWMVKGKSTRWGLSRENEFPRLDVKIGEPF